MSSETDPTLGESVRSGNTSDKPSKSRAAFLRRSHDIGQRAAALVSVSYN